MDRTATTFALGWMALATAIHTAGAAAPACGQKQVEERWKAPAPPAASKYYIEPAATVAPFYQWEGNTGYCGEVSLMQAGLNNGQWISQYNTRLVCGEFAVDESGKKLSLQQAGISPGSTANFNAQTLLQDPGEFTGPNDFGSAGRCAANARLQSTSYPTATGYHVANTGIKGYRDYMEWIKAQTMMGNQVTIGVLQHGDDDAQYDHIVSVVKIGTNHSPTDPSYYPDDVLYLEDHGLTTLERNSKGGWDIGSVPAIPPGAGSDSTACTPYVYAYRFDTLGRSRSAANAKGAGVYSVVIPNSNTLVDTVAGNDDPDGLGETRVKGPHNFGFAISGPADSDGETLPVTIDVVRTQTRSPDSDSWQVNPFDANSTPAVGYRYENPYIGGEAGECDEGECATNAKPRSMRMQLRATVHNLTAGEKYNLYRYDLPALTGKDTDTKAALKVPTGNFNENGALASHKTQIVANGPTYTTPTFTISSDQIVVFRAVPESAP